MNRINFYAPGDLDRASHLRKDEAWLRDRLTDPTSRFAPVWKSQHLVVTSPDGPTAVLARPDHVASVLPQANAVIFLGIEDGGARFAIDLPPEEAPPLDRLAGAVDEALGQGAAEPRFQDLRAVGPLLPRAEGALLAYARGVIHWHGRHRFCGVCGSPAESAEGGHVRRCANPACATTHFPRTDPAVIMLVTDGDQALLGRQPVWPKGMYSTLAGFVEPGESLEAAVAREVYEEAGVVVDDVRYHSSQPWPFPASIMLGFYATARGTDIKVDQTEIEDARWFDRDWLRTHHDDEAFRLPRADSIARRLIEDWLAQ
ncbi:MAG TPA: NAD(+) diphosphatase [Stellaceae bacterium]|nr:NAD(+) diphosphatase [Stellaceae bacterium]